MEGALRRWQKYPTMPREVRAEDIERFLGTVEGVASIRLLTSPSGEIDQIYVTADDAVEGRAARRSVVAALMTEYGIPVEPWRVHVTHLRGAHASEGAELQVVRLEETVSATEAAARVQVVWERGGEGRAGTGQARGPVGGEHRLRTLVMATVDAARSVLDAEHRRVTLQQVSTTTCMDRPVVLVGISAQTPRGPEVFVGAAPQRRGAPEAAVHAALDAVAKWIRHASFGGSAPAAGGDRRAHLEAMRHRLHAGAVPRGEWPLPSDPSADPDVPTPPSVNGPEDPGLMDPDVLEDLQEIRPEQRGGAAVTAHQEGSRVGVAPPAAEPQPLEDGFYASLVKARTPVHIRCRDGYEVVQAVLRDVGPSALLVEAGGATELLYKHAIISVRPLAPSAGA